MFWMTMGVLTVELTPPFPVLLALDPGWTNPELAEVMGDRGDGVLVFLEPPEEAA